MDDEDVLAEMQRGLSQRRGYADGRSWPTERRLEEKGVVEDFIGAATNEDGYPFSQLIVRERGEDPPDVEMRDDSGRRIAIEVTELVDQVSIQNAVAGLRTPYFPWTREEFLYKLTGRLASKDIGNRLKGGTYDEFIVLIYTDEYLLVESQVRTWLADHSFPRPSTIQRAYLSLGYSPDIGYPLIRLAW
jgi:hypothetical protein